jgi:hypothetical protein
MSALIMAAPMGAAGVPPWGPAHTPTGSLCLWQVKSTLRAQTRATAHAPPILRVLAREADRSYSGALGLDVEERKNDRPSDFCAGGPSPPAYVNACENREPYWLGRRSCRPCGLDAAQAAHLFLGRAADAQHWAPTSAHRCVGIRSDHPGNPPRTRSAGRSDPRPQPASHDPRMGRGRPQRR